MPADFHDSFPPDDSAAHADRHGVPHSNGAADRRDAENRRRAAEQWPGFEPEEALRWAKVLLHHSPDPQRAGIKAQMSSAIARGIPIAGPDWVSTADSARADGFNPVLYTALFESLRTIPKTAFRSHPGHRQATFTTYLPGTPYESELWSDWPKLFLTEGFEARTATTLALLRAEPKFPRPHNDDQG
ncbi:MULTISPECIES: hypothetical protein [unclassified Brevibacterium]|uniref:hypothetical protein n=1 Tax=unclassified Brevibacterium TaxID=2614124 RepID=UPI001092EEEF|nr:hypothetical protein [Brevibacterium sp. S22]TGD30191.1 hypothetical protein EB835_13825 [Brevibacterium sp. S22]